MLLRLICLPLCILLFSGVLKAQDYQYNNVIRVKLKEVVGNNLKQQSFLRSANDAIQTGIASIDQLNERCGAVQFKRVFPDGGKFTERRRKFGLHLWYEITFDPDKAPQIERLISDYSNDLSLSLVEPIYAKQFDRIQGDNFGAVKKEMSNAILAPGLMFTPADPRYNEQWHYNNTGQTGGTVDADIDLSEAWDIQTGNSGVIVSVHDGGIDYAHEDLTDNMWVNSAELSGSAGVDDDGNGYVDDVYGYNFVIGSGNVFPDPDGHGTHVAGTVAAVNDNGIGVSGVAGGGNGFSGIELMSCQVFTSGGGGFAESYAYAADNGAVISQNSWGYTNPGFFEQSVLDAIDYFIANAGYDAVGNPTGPMQGGIVIFAAGNSDSDSDYYPGFYDPVLAVASTNHNDQKAWYSNYGSWVDISAPGGETFVSNQGVLSTLPSNTYGFFQGTSMACPHVSGVAALIVSEYGSAGFTPDQVRFRLTETTDDIEALNPNYQGLLGAGRMNAFASLLTDDEIPPDAITDLGTYEIRHNQLTLTWTAPEDGDNTSAASYDIRYSTSPITEGNFFSASSLGSIQASTSGATETFVVTGLTASTTYYYAIKSFDFFSNESAISNVLMTTTTNPPVVEVNPTEIDEFLNTGEISEREITISNEGEGVLEYMLSVNPIDFTPSRSVLAASQVFKGLEDKLDKSNADQLTSDIYIETLSKRATSPYSEQNDLNDLGVILEDLNESYSEITDLIPNFYLFSDGESGNNILDGGGDMYDGGNYLSTDLESNINYTNSVINSSTAFGGESYFTAKFPGLFVMTADLVGVNYFEITGNLGADGSGSVDGAVLNVSQGGRNYLGFVKRVYDAFDPSVNHLIIVEDNGSLSHDFATNTNDDYHRVTGLNGSNSIHYLLFAGSNGGYYDNSIMLDVMSTYIELVNLTTGINLGEVSGTVVAGNTDVIPIFFDARGIEPGQYLNDVVITTNDPVTGAVVVNTELNVQGAPNISLSSNVIELGQVFNATDYDTAFYIRNNGTEILDVSSISSSNIEVNVSVSSVTIDPGDSVRVPIFYNIDDVGVFSATITIASNDTNTPAVDVTVGGDAVEPPIISINPTEVAENLFTGETAQRNVLISNLGGSDLTLESNIEFVNIQTSSQKNFISPAITSRFSDPDTKNKEVVFLPEFNITGKDLTGISVAVSDIFNNRAVLMQDLTTRGASITLFTNVLPDLSAFDILIVDDNINDFSVGKIDSMRSFAMEGGAILVEADDSSSEINVGRLLEDTDVRFTTFGTYYDRIFDGIEMHPTTVGVPSLNSLSYGAYYSGGETIVHDYQYAAGHVQVTGLGNGTLFLVGNELCSDGIIESNRLFINQVIDWLSDVAIKGWLTVELEDTLVPAGSSSDMILEFDATGLNGGVYEANVHLTTNDPSDMEVLVPVSLTVTGAPDIQVDLTSIEFGEVFVGSEASDSIVVENVGTDVLTISSISNSNADFELTPATMSLAVGETGVVYVTYEPTFLGELVDKVVLKSDDPDESLISINLSGIGLDPPVISVDPTSITQDLFTGETASTTVNIINTGGSDLTFSTSVGQISGSVMNHLTREYLALKTKEGHSSFEKSSSPVKVTTAASDSLILVIQNTDAWGLFMSSFIFDNYGLTADVINSSQISSTDLNEYQLVITVGDESSTYYQDLNTNLAQFETYVSNGGYLQYQVATQGDNVQLVGGVLAENGNSESFNTVASPEHPVVENLPETLEGDAANHTTLSNLPANSVVITETSNSQLPTTIEYSYGNGKVVATGMTWEFLWINNYDAGLMMLNSASYLLSQLDDFISLGTDSGTVVPGESFTLDVFFDASGLNGGIYETNLVINSNDPINSQVNILATLNVTGAPDLELGNQRLDFGQVFIGLERLDSIFIQNTGTNVLNISSISNNSSSFNVTPKSMTLEVGESDLIIVNYIPNVTGEVSDQIILTTNDPDETNVSIDLSGVGVGPPVIEVSPSFLKEQLFTGEMSTQLVTVTNNGDSSLYYTVARNSSISLSAASNNSIEPAEDDSNPYLEDGNEGSIVYSEIPINPVLAHEVLNSAEARLFVIDQTTSEIVRINPADGSNISSFMLPEAASNGPDGLAYSGEHIYFINGFGSNIIYQLDPVDGTVLSSKSFGGLPSIDALAFSGDYLVAMDYDNNMLILLDYENEVITGAIDPIDSIGGGLSFGGRRGTVFVNNFGSGIYEIDPVSSAILNSFDSPNSEDIVGLGYSEGLDILFASTYFATYALEPSDGSILYTLPVGSSALASDESDLGGWFSVVSRTGIVQAGSTEQFEVIFDANGLGRGKYEASLFISSNDPLNPEIVVPIELDVFDNSSGCLPPTLVEEVSDTLLFVGDNSTLIDVRPYFSDADSGELFFSGSVNDESVAVVDFAEFVMAIEPISLGTTEVRLIARDDFCGFVETIFEVTVDEFCGGSTNLLPQITVPFNAMVVKLDQESVEMDLNNHFIDPEGGNLTYSVDYDATIIDVVMNRSIMIITMIDAGSATVIVTAEDERCGTVSATFEMTIENITSLDDLSNAELTFYPNPVDDLLTVSFNHNLEFIKGTIVSLQGKVVREFDINKSDLSISLDTSVLAEGSYILQLAGVDTFENVRFVVTH
ncbi:MAG: S8 family serine peptidase [Bacteroidota bacterium]